MFTCTICNELIGDETFSTHCGHIFHYDCIVAWLQRSTTCPICRAYIGNLIKLFLTEDKRFIVKSREEIDSLVETNTTQMSSIRHLRSQLSTTEDKLKKSTEDFNNLNDVYSSMFVTLNNMKIENDKKNTNSITLDYKTYNAEKSKKILLQKEVYELRSINAAEINKLKSEIDHLKSEKAYFQSRCHCYERPSTSKMNTRSKNVFLHQIQSSKLQPSSEGFLSNCCFWIIDDLRKVSGASDHLYFNEQRIIEHGGKVAYHYTNIVTHVIGISQKHPEVIRGLEGRKKCVTDYWLSDIIGEKKIIKPWLAHHFPVPYSDDNLPFANKQMAIINFEKNEYHIIQAMAEVAGACVINKISHNTDIVISLKLKGEVIKRASSLKIPIVNVQWINDVLLGEKMALQNFQHSKYQNYDLPNPFLINFDRVSHLMEAWIKRSSILKRKL